MNKCEANCVRPSQNSREDVITKQQKTTRPFFIKVAPLAEIRSAEISIQFGQDQPAELKSQGRFGPSGLSVLLSWIKQQDSSEACCRQLIL